ncbi:MAG: hypothetical protein ICV76_05720 [Nitrospiraceae bacterium]|nr:hypothetical protein [Nitrospiraceae bacterium]
MALLTDAHSPEERRAALQAFEDFRNELWTQFPDLNKSAGGGSVGAGLLLQDRIQEGLMMLIREAYALSESAHTLL